MAILASILLGVTSFSATAVEASPIFCAIATCQTGAKSESGTDTTQLLRKLVAEYEQDLKAPSNRSPELAAEISQRFRTRLAQVRDLTLDDRLKTPEDFQLAGILFYGSGGPDEMLSAHELHLMAWRKGKPGNGTALAWDRFLVKNGYKQRFGSQSLTVRGGLSRRYTMDSELPLGVTDALRADLGCPPAAAAIEDGLLSIGASQNAINGRLAARSSQDWITEKAKSPEHKEILQLEKKPLSEEVRKRVLELYAQDKLYLPEDYRIAAIIVLSGDDIKNKFLAHELATVAAVRKDPKGLDLFVRTLDVALVSLAKLPRYATQPLSPPISRIVNPTIRKALGLESQAR